MTLLILGIYVLACARLTRLVNSDTILDPFRLVLVHAARSAETAGQPREQARWGKLLYFTQCPWCVGFWICLAAAYLPAHLIGWPWWTVFPVALAASHLIGVFARFADTEVIEVHDDDD